MFNGHPVPRTLPPRLSPSSFVWVGPSLKAFYCPFDPRGEDTAMGLLDLPKSLTNPINRQALIFYNLREILEAEERPAALEDNMVGSLSRD